MTGLGTIQSSRKGLPKHFTSTDGREVGDYQVLYDEKSRISIHSEICKNKSGDHFVHLFVCLLSSFALRTALYHFMFFFFAFYPVYW